MIFDLVFFIVLTSILLQGTSLPLFARWLGLEAPVHNEPKPPLILEPDSGIQSELVDIEIPPGSPVAGKQIVGAAIPKGALIVLINRANEFLVPNGGTVLESGDRVLVLADKEDLAQTRAAIETEASQKKR
jgi:cell volume regulation protein A